MLSGCAYDVGVQKRGIQLGKWKRHPKKELQAVLEEFDRQGWVIIDPPKYYQLRCPCGQHYRWLHLTPSNPQYGRQALQWAKRCPMWKENQP